MVVRGIAKFVGSKSGAKGTKSWCSLTLDAVDDPLERLIYFVPDDLMDKVSKLSPGDVQVEVRIYPVKDGMFGSRLLDINPVDVKPGDLKPLDVKK